MALVGLIPLWFVIGSAATLPLDELWALLWRPRVGELLRNTVGLGAGAVVSCGVIGVGATDASSRIAAFSNRGRWVDVTAPGVAIWSTYKRSGYVAMNGTSMATPFVAGMMGLYRAALSSRGLPVPTVYELRKLWATRSTDAHTPGDDRRTGPGWLTPLLLALTLTPDPPKVG